ncbi:MFS transporter [Bacteroides helcogenes]|uniref:Major facilitator superfamily MFS_1 n=1 Tax=Bacteroides helcogenes (strain ATCC 35417 / DSM 20613 / JCM 6297 / CCUG 15421 / P 36-108) TaxID=693979 RepID=E6SN59_BACT6|nr:MFS transporter [Bacteroides helcogenes]ADV44712.1 major facilitator superfamily MFS_1 [Bacteroides helcogenes P 36-108]MDY5238527.1 MFS transporter [Bacteroides helcogenes]
MIKAKQHLQFHTQGKIWNLGTFFCLYIAQAIPMSFFSTSLQVLMRQADYSLSTIALLQAVKIPWILKCLWSPLVDRQCIAVKDYKRCIIISEIVYALMILLVGLLSLESDFHLILALIFFSLVASATQDIATDALAVLSFREHDKSLVNSMQSMGSFGGTLIGAGLLLLVLQHYGWHIVIPCLCIFVLLAIIPLIFNTKIKIVPKERAQRARLTDFVWFFTRRSIWRQIGFLTLYYSSIIGILSVLRPYLVDLGYSMKEIGMMSGIIGTTAAFFTSFIAGFIVRHIGRYKARITFAVFILLTTLYFMGISWGHPSTLALYIGIVLLWSSYGMATIIVYTTAMDCVRPGREGTDFTIQTVLTHLSGLLIALLSGIIADKAGYHGLFLSETVLASISLIYILFAFRRSEENKKQIYEL